MAICGASCSPRPGGCLDAGRRFRGWPWQVVTMRKTGEKKTFRVCPHLNVSTRIEADPRWYEDKLDAAMDRAIAELRPIHEWVYRVAKSN
jgi:hypothetical protein